MAQRYFLQAEFADGFVYTGDEADVSIVDKTRNAFFDIKEGLHAEHGKIVRYSCLGVVPNKDGKYEQYHIDFSILPESTKPIWFIKRERDKTFAVTPDGELGQMISETEPRDMCYGFGYKFTNDKGEIEKEVLEFP